MSEPSPSRCSQRGANGVRCESFHDDEKGCHFVERIDGKIMFRIGPWTPAREAERLRRIAADDPLY